MAPRFYSREWCEAVKQKGNSDEGYLSKTKGFTVKLMFILTNCPDGNDVKVIWDYNDGKMDYTYEEKKAPSNMRIGQERWDESISLTKNQADYDIFVKVQKGEMAAVQALGAKQWLLEGDMVKGMKFMRFNPLVTEIQKSIPCEY